MILMDKVLSCVCTVCFKNDDLSNRGRGIYGGYINRNDDGGFNRYGDRSPSSNNRGRGAPRGRSFDSDSNYPYRTTISPKFRTVGEHNGDQYGGRFGQRSGERRPPRFGGPGRNEGRGDNRNGGYFDSHRGSRPPRDSNRDSRYGGGGHPRGRSGGGFRSQSFLVKEVDNKRFYRSQDGSLAVVCKQGDDFMRVKVNLIYQQKWLDILPDVCDLVGDVATFTLINQGVDKVFGNCRLRVDLVGDIIMKKKIEEYSLDKEEANVLAFPQIEIQFDKLKEMDKVTDSVEIGRVLLCASTIEKEAKSKQKSVAALVTELVIHGVLHVLGCDHEDENSAGIMSTLEQGIYNDYAASVENQRGEKPGEANDSSGSDAGIRLDADGGIAGEAVDSEEDTSFDVDSDESLD